MNHLYKLNPPLNYIWNLLTHFSIKSLLSAYSIKHSNEHLFNPHFMFPNLKLLYAISLTVATSLSILDLNTLLFPLIFHIPQTLRYFCPLPFTILPNLLIFLILLILFSSFSLLPLFAFPKALLRLSAYFVLHFWPFIYPSSPCMPVSTWQRGGGTRLVTTLRFQLQSESHRQILVGHFLLANNSWNNSGSYAN